MPSSPPTSAFTRVIHKLTAALLLAAATATAITADTAAREIDRARFDQIDQLIDQAIADGQIPGGVLLVGRDDQVVYRRAYGDRAVRPYREPATVDTVYDLASLTKPIATATSVMILVDRGLIEVTDPVSKHLPAFAANGKSEITVEQLLLHRGGLIPDNHLRDYADGPGPAIERVMALKPTWEPGSRFEYTDVGYIVLAELVRAVDGRALDLFARDELFTPLRMHRTGYNPPAAWLDRCAPTTQRGGRWLRGEVHDPRAIALGGVAGHAGLFSTADDLARYCRMLINGGELNGRRVLSAETVKAMTKPRCFDDGSDCRAYGFDVDTGYSSARGDRFAVGTTFGHTGFTGPMFWIDPANRCYVVFLTNRVHPDGKGNVIALRRRIATLAAEALLGPAGDGEDAR